MPGIMYNFAMSSSLDNKVIYTFGGKSAQPSTYDPRTFKYDVELDQWTVLTLASRTATVIMKVVKNEFD